MESRDFRLGRHVIVVRSRFACISQSYQSKTVGIQPSKKQYPKRNTFRAICLPASSHDIQPQRTSRGTYRADTADRQRSPACYHWHNVVVLEKRRHPQIYIHNLGAVCTYKFRQPVGKHQSRISNRMVRQIHTARKHRHTGTQQRPASHTQRGVRPLPRHQARHNIQNSVAQHRRRSHLFHRAEG